MNQQATENSRPKVLLVGDASARPTGLERALSRAGFQLIEREETGGVFPPADAVLITLSDLDENPPSELLFPSGRSAHETPPRLVLIASSNPDAPAAALAWGAADALVAPVHLPELCARLYARIRERHQASSQVTPAAENGREPAGPSLEEATDPSSELEQRVQEELERARRYSLSFSLILLGVDELPGSDESMGDESGDRLRCEVSRTLRRELRVPDLVAPYGASEFAIVLPETGQSGARQSVIRLRERLSSLPFPGDPRLEPSRFSAGIVTFPHPAAHEAEDLFAMAEAALMRGRAQSMERIGVAM